MPLAIDELPLVALAACFAEGETTSAARPSCGSRSRTGSRPWSRGCAALGADIEATEDGFVVDGTGGLRGGAIDSHGDHRLAMLGAVAGLASGRGSRSTGMDAAAVSYPGFEPDLAALLGGG